MKPISVLVVDDHDLFRAGISLIIKSNFPAAEVQTFAGLGEAIDRCSGPPDLLLLDYNLNGVGGDTGIALARSCWPDAALIVVTAETDHRVLDRIRAVSNTTLLSKAAPPDALLDLARAALAPDDADQAMTNLSARQLEILRLMREGQSNKAIARQVGLSEFTVRGHVQRIFKVTGAGNRTSAVYLAEKAGLI